MINYIRRRFRPLWRLRQLRWYRALQRALDFPVPVARRQMRVWVMFLRDFGYVVPNRGTEAVTHCVFEHLLREFNIDRVFDIGANIGSFAWHSLRVNPSMQVFLFEPDATNIRLIKRTIRSNHLAGVHLWEGAVSNMVGVVEFLIDDVSGATGSIKDNTHNSFSLHAAYGMSRKTLVSATRLDAYIDPTLAGHCLLVKIDVEGGEREVFDGGLKFIKSYRPFVIVECFDRKNLMPLLVADYLACQLPENGNYLLIPGDRWQEFRQRAILDPDALRRCVPLAELLLPAAAPVSRFPIPVADPTLASAPAAIAGELGSTLPAAAAVSEKLASK